MGPDRPLVGRDRGTDVRGHAASTAPEPVAGPSTDPSAAPDAEPPCPVALTRTARGWAVHSPAGTETAGDLVEGLSLADLVAEEFGALREPDRTARRSARGPGGTAEAQDPVQARVAELERTVAQLEHALAARVSTERAIGVLAERHGTSARAAFESLRRDARSHGRPVAELAREVLDSLTADADAAQGQQPGRSVPTAGAPRTGTIVVAVAPQVALVSTGPPAVTATDGAS
jgi:ANTAR domain